MRKGITHSDEVKERIRQKLLGGKMSDITKKKMSIAGKGKKQTEEHKKKKAEGRRKFYDKVGRKTIVGVQIRMSTEYKNWRKSVFERDNYTCVLCLKKSKKDDNLIIQADHIKPFAFYPELRFDINNGRTLCLTCHKKTDTYGRNGKAKINNKII